MLELAALALSGVGLAGGVLSIRAGEAARWRASLEALELRFPSGIEPTSVAAFVTGIAGLVAPRHQRPFVVRAVAFEVRSTNAGIRFFLLVAPTQRDVVVASLRAAIPGAVVRDAADFRAARPVAAAELGLSDSSRPLNTDQPEAVTAGLLAALQPVEPNDELVLQWIVSPAGPLPIPASPTEATKKALFPNQSTTVGSREAWRATVAKRSGAVFDAVVRLGVVSPSPKRAAQLLNRLSAPFHAVNALGANLFRRRLPNGIAVRRLANRRIPLLRYPCVFNAEELSALLGLPIGELELEGLSLGVSRLRPPSSEIPSTGLVLCRANYPGRERNVAISWRAAMEHIGLFGGTGVGKTVLAVNLALQAVASGHGLLFVDPHGDGAVDLVSRMTPSRTDDLIWVSPTDDVVVGLNVLAGLATTPELAADLVVNALRHRWGGTSWGPRLEQLLWAAIVTLTAAGETLVELQRVFTDPVYRRRLVAKLDDPFGALPTWSRYESWSEAEQAQAAASVLNKAVFGRPELRALVGQRASIDFDAALRDGKIIVVSIPKGRLGQDAAVTTAGLVLGAYWMAVLRRAGTTVAERRPSLVVLDEAHQLFSLPTSVGLALAESRKYNVAWALAMQSVGQIPTPRRFPPRGARQSANQGGLDDVGSGRGRVGA